MIINPKSTISYWIDSTSEENFPSLTSDILVDVAIIGGGIVGLTAATLLKQAGKKVAVVDAKQIGMGVSGHTTAKVTSLHQLIYADLIKEVGEEKARLYAESNQAAVEKVASLVDQYQIDCDFSRQSAYTFARPDDDLSKIEKEIEAAIKLGLPASFVQETSLPFPIAGAIKLDHQVQFHVRKYLLHLAKNLVGDGSYVFENTKVVDVKGENPCSVVTEKHLVYAQDVLVTTHLPILNRGLFFAKTYPKRSYIIGATIVPEKAPQGMFIGYGNEYHSIRTTPDPDGGLLLLVGGESHKVGEKTHTQECYDALYAYARQHFEIGDIKYHWSTQDMVSFDKIPFIGKLTPIDNHIYVATGFSLWGMSNGTLSGMILSDLILGRENPWVSLYDATRVTPFVTPNSLKSTVDLGVHFLGDRLKGIGASSEDLEVGEGKIFNIKGEQVAAYKDETGEVHSVSAVCTHLGCIVNWNEAEKSWDCPCHGARYSCKGAILHGPAIQELEIKNISTKKI